MCLECMSLLTLLSSKLQYEISKKSVETMKSR